MTRAFDDFAVGEEARLERTISAEDVAAYVALTGDDNPVHVDDAYATGMGLPRRVVHGMLTSSYVSTAIGTLLPGPGALWLSERFAFHAPVLVGDTVAVTITVRRLSPATRVLVLDVRVTTGRDRLVLSGQANVQILEKAEPMSAPPTGAQTVIVTGGGRGIGAAIAARLAADGARVVIAYRADEARARATVEAIEGAGGQASALCADVRDPAAVAALHDHAVTHFGPVDGLVCNAGSPPDPRPLADTTWDDVQAHLDGHLRGSFHCLQAVRPGMVERGFGRIVTITSQAAYGTPPTEQSGYVVAKAALAALTRAAALELGPRGVTVNAVAPGLTETEMVADVPARAKAVAASQTPLRRLASVGEIADAVAFLLGPGGAYVSGQTLHLSGGRVMT